MAKFGDRIKAWWRGAGSGDAALVGARGVSQGSPDALRVISPAETGPVVAPVEMGNSLVNGLGLALNMGTDLLSKYIDLELMDEYDYLSAALDVYADDATVQDVQRKHIVWGTGNDRLARGMVDDLLYRRLKIEEDAWPIVRTMSKYGQACGEILADERGVHGINYLPPASMRKVLDGRGACIGYVQAVTAAAFTTVTSENFAKLLAERGDGPNKDGVVVFHPWEIVWWQMPGKQVRAPYGESVLSAARWAWKRLVMLEDAAVQFRLTKAPSRYLIGVECGFMPDKQIPGHLNRVKQSLKKTRVVDPCLTGDTLIRCLDGKARSMKELANSNSDVWVYSFDLATGRVVPGKATRARKTGEMVPVYRVVLDNGSVVRSTGNHPFLMRNGEYKRCDELIVNDRLMPLYLCSEGKRTTGNGYVRVKQPLDGKKTSVHMMVASELWHDKISMIDDCVVHHIDQNKSNNDPSNLMVMSRNDHAVEHINESLAKGRNGFANRIKNDDSFRDMIYERLEGWRRNNPLKYKECCSRTGRISSEKKKLRMSGKYEKMMKIIKSIIERDPLITAASLVRELNSMNSFIELYSSMETTKNDCISCNSLLVWLQKRGYSGFREFKYYVEKEKKNRMLDYEETIPDDGVINHRIVDIAYDCDEDVYNMEVDKYSNFALYAGVFVHNCTGQLDFRPNPTALDEDFIVAMREGAKQLDVEVLNGPDFNIIDDLEYFQKKMMQATHVPKGYVDSGEVTRAALSQADVAFARTEMRVQQRFLAGLRQVQRLHFALLGVDPDEVDVGMDMAVPSSILEMSQIEAGNAKAALAAACADFLDRRTILVQVLGYSEAEAEAIIRARKADYQAQVGLEAAGQAAMMGAGAVEGAEGAEGVGPVPGEPGEPEQGGAQAAQEAVMRRMAQRVDRSVQELSEDVERLGQAVRRTDDNVRRLPRVVQRALAAGGRRGRE